MSYNTSEQQVIDHAYTKVEALFKEFPAPAHGLDHAKRVAEWSKEIAVAEGEDVFMAELCGLLHDVGRATEFHNNPDKKRHHELSYDLLRVWFREDKLLKSLTDNQKMEVLYALRWHWNDVADEYESAIILRDADKLDSFGHIGLERTFKFCAHTPIDVNTDLRFRYQFVYWLRKDSTKKIFEDKSMIDPINDYYKKMLNEAIVPCEL